MTEHEPAGHCRARWLWAAWMAAGTVLIVLLAALSAQSWRFGYAFEVYQMPILPMVAVLMGAGLVYLSLLWLIPATLRCRQVATRPLLLMSLAVGLLMRLVLLPSEPILEDDYQRYLWDGAVTAAGFNPYALAPKTALDMRPTHSEIGALARQAGKVLERVNHPELRTIYPPAAQLAFAAAHHLSPFSLLAWRLLCLLGEITSLVLILALLHKLARPALWSTLYWWNPLAAKELINSAHMEALLVPLLLALVWLALCRRPLTAIVMTMTAVGTKLWPALYLPLLVRPLLRTPARLVLALLLIAGIGALLAWPVLLAGLDHSSGFVAYAERWKTNSALFPLLEDAMGTLLALVPPALLPTPQGHQSTQTALAALAGLTARALILITLGLLALKLALPPRRGALPPQDSGQLAPFFIIAAATFLLSPAQFPWYYLWVLPFLVFFPYRGLLLLTALLPLYYAGFHLMVRGTMNAHGTWLVLLIWLPAWIMLALEVGRLGPMVTDSVDGADERGKHP